MRARVRVRSAGLLSTGVLLCAGMLASCGSSGQSVKTSSILTSDPATRTAHLLLVSSSTPAYGGFNFDGYGGGAMRVIIPLGWQVDVTCKNAAANLTHSCAIVEDLQLSPYGAPLAFPGASSPDPQGGVAPGATTSFRFVASKVGTYRIACLVSGHEIDGMWDWLTVSAGGVPKLNV